MRHHSKSSHSPQELRWEAIQDNLIERLWNALVVLAAVGMPASVARTFVTGWLPAYGFHIAIASVFFVLTLFRNRVSTKVKATLIVSLLAAVAFSGLLNFGLFSQAGVISVVFVLLCGIMFDRRTAILLSVAFVVAIVGVAFGFSSGRLQIIFDANLYARSSIGWIFMMLVALLFGTLVATAVAAYRNSIRTLLLEIKQQRDEIEHQAFHDPLTGLPTLQLASDRLEMAINSAKRNSRKCALMFIDLDGFKGINDTFGHEAGDAVLIEVANRLKDVVRISDTASRIGGDEFLVIFGEFEGRDQASETAQRIIRAVSRPIPYKEHQLSISCSIGIAIFPDHATDAHTLRRSADTAMYEVKRSGKNSFAFCADDKTGEYNSA